MNIGGFMGGRGSSSRSSGGGSSYTDVFMKYRPSGGYDDRGISSGVAGSIYRAYKNNEVNVSKNLTSYIYNNVVGHSPTTNSRESEPAIALRVAANALRSNDSAAAMTAINKFIEAEARDMTSERRQAFLKYVNS